MNYQLIVPLLGVGRENAISTADLMQAAGACRESLQRRIREDRRKAKTWREYPISCEYPGGYYLPKTAEELEDFAETQKRKAGAISASVNDIEQLLKGAKNE